MINQEKALEIFRNRTLRGLGCSAHPLNTYGAQVLQASKEGEVDVYYYEPDDLIFIVGQWCGPWKVTVPAYQLEQDAK